MNETTQYTTKNTLAICIHAEYRSHFVHQLVSKKTLIDPQSRLVLVDEDTHAKENFVLCESIEDAARIVKNPADHLVKKERPTYAFVYSRNCDESIVKEYVDNGVASVLSVKGLLMGIKGDERLWFIEFNRVEDTRIVKDQLFPGCDPASVHVCSKHRATFTANGRHFLCSRTNRKETTVSTKTGSLNQIALQLQDQPHIDTAMLQFLKHLLVSSDTKKRQSKARRGTAARASKDDDASEDESSRDEPDSDEDEEDSDEDEDEPPPASKKLKSDPASHIDQESFNALSNAQVKALLIGRMRTRVQNGTLTIPAWVKGAFATMRDNERVALDMRNATLAAIFNVPSTVKKEKPHLFRHADSDWTSESFASHFEDAVSLGEPIEDETENRPFVALTSELMRALGVM
jgi:hypothetical protein